MRTATRADHVGIAEYDPDRLEWHAQQVRRDLGKAGLVALPRRLRPDHDLDTVGVNDEVCTFLRRPDRRLDIVRKAQSEELAAGTSLRAPGRKSLPVG